MKKSEFYELLVKLSTAISKKEKHVDMLSVLYRDMANRTELEEAESAFDLFQLLIGPGILKPTDISVLFETIQITGFRYLKEIIEQYETNPKEVKITRFSAHRQHVVALGRGFSVKDVKKLSQLYRDNLVFPNQWKLIEDLETDVLTEEKMSTFLQCLKENEVNKDFNQLLLELSEAISKKDEKYVDMLRVLYTDHAIIKTELEEAKSAFELFQILIVADILNPKDISVLFETIKLTGLRYLKKIIETYEAYPDEVKITRFSQHRQHLVALGRDFSIKGLQTVCQMYEIPDNISTNPWKVITFLENEGIILEGHLSSLLMNLKTVGSGETSTRQMSDKDIFIRDFLTKRQKHLYQDVNCMTPTIWHEDHEVDIGQVFTELILVQSTKKDRKSKAKSSSMKLEGRSTSLNEVLDVIKSTESCKVLITGKGGMGKTTLLRYIAYQWATDGVYNAFADKLLFLINIRDIKANQTFFEIITKKIDVKALIFEHNLPSNSVEAFMFIHADKIVILLDGYDELGRDAKDPIDLFEGNELGKCTVLMSSRPDTKNIVKLVKFCDVHIIVKGFGPKNIKKYIRNHFRSIGKDEMGISLVTKLISDYCDKSDDVFYYGDDNFLRRRHRYCGHHQKTAFELCSSPLLLLKICIIWEDKMCLPSDLSELFKELFCAILNQFLNKDGTENAISQFHRIPKKYADAIQLLGECMYKSLKENKLSIDGYDLSEIAKNKKECSLALKLGFVYRDSLDSKGDLRKIYTTPHKLISESLAGFYLYQQIQKGSLKTDEYEVIRFNDFLHMTRVFAIGFLGANACKLLRHWLVGQNYYPYPFSWRMYSLTADNLEKFVESIGENETLNWKRIDMSRINLSSISGRTLACLCKISTHLIHIDIRHCSLSGSIVNEMMEECRRMNVALKDNMLSLEGNNLKDIDGKSLAKLINIINHTDGPFTMRRKMSRSDYSYPFPWSVYSLTADNLEKLVESIGENETLNWKRIDMRGINLSSISGRTLACLCKISTHLIHIDMSHCSLSGSIINEMMEECRRVNVALKDNMLSLGGNNLSDIDVKSLAKLVSMFNHTDYPLTISRRMRRSDYSYSFPWSDYSLTADNLEKFIESIGENETLNLKRIDLSRIDLSSISGRTLACLCNISTLLIHIDMSCCNLSGSIINEMMEECHRMNVGLKDNLLSLGGNNLSDIDGKSLAKLLEVIYGFTFKWSDYSLTANNLEKLVESIGENKTLNLKRIDLNGINLSSISGRTLACLCKISTHLIHIDMRYCSLSGSILNEMMEECRRMNVALKDNMLSLAGNNLSNIDVKSLAKLVSIFNHTDGPLRMRRRMRSDYSYPFPWSDYSLTADNLEKFVESIGENETLNWKRIDMSRINLSSISGRTLACLCKISKHLIHIDMRHCSLSGSIIFKMIEECCRLNVALKKNMLSLEGNNLSDINGKSLAKLVSVISHPGDPFRENNYSYRLRVRNDIDPHRLRDFSDPQPDITFKWRDYSLTANNLEKLVESIGENETLNLKRIDLNGINLSSISGRTLACLCKISTHLIHIDMRYCSLSGSILNEMMEECCRMNVALKDNMLSLEGNNLSNIDVKSLAKLVSIFNHTDGPLRMRRRMRSDYSYPFPWSDYSLTANNLEKFVESIGENETLNWKRIDMSRINLSSIRGRTLACLCKISTHLIHIDMRHCSLSGSIINEMVEECRRMNVALKYNMLSLGGNNLSDIDVKSLAKLVSMFNHTDGSFRRRMRSDYSYSFPWSEYSLTADNLEKFVESIGENKTLNWKRIDMSRINLSSISGRTLACLCKISTHLIHINMSHCSLSGSIINEMMEQCHRKNVALKDNMLSLGGNNLSDIDGKSLAKLVSMNNYTDGPFRWSDYSLTANNLEKLVESIGENETLNWKRIDMSGINLSSISGRTLACLCKISTHLIHVDMSHCTLSGSIINEMMGECCRMNVALKDNMLSLVGNDLSDFDDKFSTELIRIMFQIE
ncbi:uncharacterized protein LOC117124812 [Anneissia japonica]|uniref:uncharacterized protein LOC117124812 n=1 Tax=Anneissia japonica TaxID=1529436 RepID=UPI001425ACE6|nr:uncharacterized protein LOC117124812 [Anneissia japonica]